MVLFAPLTSNLNRTTLIHSAARPGSLPERSEPASTQTYQPAEFLSFNLSHVKSHRLCLMGVVRLLECATQIGDTDGLQPKDLRTYSKNVAAAYTRFDRTIKPKGLISSLREKLFDD